ncbi:16S rRNA (cytidine(1402)-2'-O)-methyltransferase [Campylobacter pinnipediorum]|uniref:16S rRNA (cytidine(1402)-2'-O)-methyltransferase n=1 Tax=Campylobacter pinnipediorum TaxID=1965231 RepID=UPI00084D0983|nr:16S rRNA (cytidine(1402)-2'-O)-methyltransferase [Campylobacter pinnipediorum]
MIYFIPTPIGNLKDISLHALDILRECEIVLCEDTRVTKSLFTLLNDRFNANIDISIFIPFHTHNCFDFLDKVTLDFFSKNIAYVSDAGMPCISDPGVELVRYALKNNINYEVLSGSNASILAIVASGILEKEFIFLGFLPNNGSERKLAIQNAMHLPYPVVLYESPKRILELIQNLSNIDPEREIFVIKEATKKFETKIKDSSINLVEKLKNINLNGEWSVVIDKSKNVPSQSITVDDIYSLDIPPKNKAKLISKITGEDVKKIYNNIIK